MREWSLISCQVFSNLIRHYRRTFRAVKRGPLIVANVYYRKKHSFHNDISSHFKLLFSNERLDFCELFK